MTAQTMFFGADITSIYARLKAMQAEAEETTQHDGATRIQQVMFRWHTRRQQARHKYLFQEFERVCARLADWAEETKQNAEEKMVVIKPWQKQSKQNQLSVKVLKRQRVTKPSFHRPQTR